LVYCYTGGSRDSGVPDERHDQAVVYQNGAAKRNYEESEVEAEARSRREKVHLIELFSHLSMVNCTCKTTNTVQYTLVFSSDDR